MPVVSKNIDAIRGNICFRGNIDAIRSLPQASEVLCAIKRLAKPLKISYN